MKHFGLQVMSSLVEAFGWNDVRSTRANLAHTHEVGFFVNHPFWVMPVLERWEVTTGPQLVGHLPVLLDRIGFCYHCIEMFRFQDAGCFDVCLLYNR